MPAIWQRLESLGMITTEACGDTPARDPRLPVAGIAADEEIDPQPAIDAILERYIGNKAFSNLPRKFKTAISWQQDVAHEVNDVSFVGVVHPEHGPGFDLWVGGGLSTNPKIAQRLGVWVPLDEVPDVWEGVISIFRDYGYRRLRHRARIKFLVADWGVEKFRAGAAGRVPPPHAGRRARARDPGAADRPRRGAQAARRAQLRRCRAGVGPGVGDDPGRRWPTRPSAPARGRVRLTPQQKVVVLDVPDGKVDALKAALNTIGLQAEPSIWRRSTMACTGIEFCKLAIVETKERAIRLVEELEKRLADVHPDVPISIHLNGCPNACARTQVADIGLKGMIVTDAGGNQVEGFQVHLGGGLGLDAGFGRKLRGLKVTSAELGDYVDRLVRRFVDQREPGERFAQWVVRAAEDDLK